MGLAVLELGLHAEVAGLDIEADVAGHLGPPVVVHDQLQCLPASGVASDARVMVLFHNATVEVSVSRDIDLPTEHMEAIQL